MLTLSMALAVAAGGLHASLPRVYGLSIGNNAVPAGESELAPLRFADDDAVRFFELFDRVAVKAHLLAVLDDATQRRYASMAARAEPPTLVEVERAVADLRRRLIADRERGLDSVVYVFFSGHGSARRDGEPYLALLDGELTRARLFDRIIARLPAKRLHLIVDACNAGALVGVRGPFDDALEATAESADPAKLAELAGARSLDRFPHVGVVLAASAGQAAHEWSRIASGVFSHEVYSALVGGGDVNADRRIEYSELQAFVGAANSKLVDPRARPTIKALAPAADRRSAVFDLKWLEPGPFLVGRAGNEGRFFVERADGQRVFDVHLSPGTAFTLALPADQVAYVRTDEAEARLVSGQTGEIAFDELAFSSRALAERGAIDDELRRGLFGAAYGPTYYRGYVDSQSLVPVDFERALTLSASESGRSPPLRRWAIATWIVAGAALVTGAVAGALALERRSAFDDAATQRAAADIADGFESRRTVSIVGFAAAGALAGVGAALWLSADDGTEGHAGAPEGPAPGWTAGLTWRGAF